MTAPAPQAEQRPAPGTAASVRRFLLRHVAGLTPTEQTQLGEALRQAVEKQAELAARGERVCPVAALESDERGYWVVENPAGATSLETLLSRSGRGESLPAGRGSGNESLPAGRGSGNESLPAGRGSGSESLPAGRGSGSESLPAGRGPGAVTPLPGQQVAQIGVHLCSALQATCYPPGAMPRPHGVLRPACVYVAGDRVLISDVGIGAAISGVLGPAAPREELDLLAPYVARELWLNPEGHGELRDLFAVGVMLYELATGQHPYRVKRDDFNDCEQRLLLGRVSRAADTGVDLHPSLAAVLDRAVAPREEDRYATLADLRDALLPIAGAAALGAAAELPAEAVRLEDREGLAGEVAIQVLAERVVRTLVERSGLWYADDVQVSIGQADATPEGAVEARLGSRSGAFPPLSLDLEIVRDQRGMLVRNAATVRATVVEALSTALAGEQQRALVAYAEEQSGARAGGGASAGALGGLRLETELPRAVPAMLARLQCGRELDEVAIELALRWDPARRAWAEQTPGALLEAARTALAPVVAARVRREIVEPSAELMAVAEALPITVRDGPASDFPRRLAFAVKLEWLAGETATVLDEFEFELPRDVNRDLARRSDRARRALRRAQRQPGAPAGPSRGMLGPFTAAAAGLLVVVAAVGWFWRPGTEASRKDGVADANRSAGVQDVNEAVHVDDANEQAHVPDPNELARQRAEEEQRALQREFDVALEELSAMRAASSETRLLALRDRVTDFVNRFAPDRDRLTSPQREAIEDMDGHRSRLTEMTRALEAAQSAPSVASLRGFLASAESGRSIWVDTTAAAAAALESLGHSLSRVETAWGQPDLWAADHFLDLTERQAVADTALPVAVRGVVRELVSGLRAHLVQARLQELADLFTAARQWLPENPRPSAVGEQLRAMAGAAAARRQLDAMKVYLPLGPLDSVAGDQRIDGLLRWGDLPDADKQVLVELRAWTLVELSLPAQNADAPKLTLAIVPGGPRDAAPSIWMGVDELTQAQYAAVTRAAAGAPRDGQLPQANITPEQARAFCATLATDLSGVLPQGLAVDLPSAAEWHRAVLAGDEERLPEAALGRAYAPARTYDPNSGTAELDLGRFNFLSHESFDDDVPIRPAHRDGYKDVAPVDAYAPNLWLFRHLLGNLHEWVWMGADHQTRGGSYEKRARDCLTGLDKDHRSRMGDSAVGFRIVIRAENP